MYYVMLVVDVACDGQRSEATGACNEKIVIYHQIDIIYNIASVISFLLIGSFDVGKRVFERDTFESN